MKWKKKKILLQRFVYTHSYIINSFFLRIQLFLVFSNVYLYHKLVAVSFNHLKKDKSSTCKMSCTRTVLNKKRFSFIVYTQSRTKYRFIGRLLYCSMNYIWCRIHIYIAISVLILSNNNSFEVFRYLLGWKFKKSTVYLKFLDSHTISIKKCFA